MPKINNLTRYPYDYVIRDNDFLLGSDAENAKKTKNFPMFALGSYFDNYISGGNVDKVLSIGEVVTTTSDVTLNVHPMGNVVRISGLIYNKQIPDYFTFTPVSTGIKVLIIYALPDAQIFYLAEGEEGLEAVEPTLPQGALYVTRILVTVEGATIQPIDYTGFREKRIDGWYTYLMVDGENTVSINGLRTMKFRLIRSGQSQDNQLFLVGIKSFQPNYIYDGIPAYFKNDTGKDIILKQPDSTIGYNIEFANTPYLLKAGNTVELAYHKASNKFEIFKMGTAVSKTSELINDGEDGLNPFITAEDIPDVTVPTKTSDLTNDGEDGQHPFITAEDIPEQTPQVNADWNATEGVAQILNKPTIPEIVPQEQSDWNATSGVSFIKNKPTIPAPVDISGKLDKPLAPNNVPERVINADGSTSDKGDFQLSEQIEISANQTAQDAWKGKEIWVTASCTLTIPAPSALSAAWNIDILVFPSVTLTLAITSGGAWLHTTPATVTDAFFRIARRGNTTTFKTLGL